MRHSVAGGRNMDKITWIKDLIRAEQQMEESGMIEITTGFEPEKQLHNETLLFLNSLKREFVDTTTAFNQMKGSQNERSLLKNLFFCINKIL